MIELFAKEEVRMSLGRLLALAQKQHFDHSQDLSAILNFFLGKPDVDNFCQTTISHLGDRVINWVESGIKTKEGNERIFCIMYRFLREVMIRGGNDDREGAPLSSILSKYNPTSKDVNFSSDLIDELNYSNNEFPIVIYAEQARKIELYVDRQNELDKNFKARIEKYDQEDIRLSALENLASKLKSEFNFVALSHGFLAMEEEKKKERNRLVIFMTIIQALILGIPTLVFFNFDGGKGLGDFWRILFHSIPIVTIELMLLYIFRVILHQFNNVKTILLQIELRRNICQFIEGYADYAKELKEKNPISLEKFETLIFSGLISNQNQLPSSFDGIEQLAKLANAMRGK